MHKTEIAKCLGKQTNSREHSPTAQAYGELNAAYEVFNQLLFDGTLPHCLITLQRNSHRVHGYYCHGRFRSNRHTDVTTDEIAMNPMHFEGQNVTEVLQTLAHEMATSGNSTTASPLAGGITTANGPRRCCRSACTRPLRGSRAAPSSASTCPTT